MDIQDIIKQSGLKLGFQKLFDKQVEAVKSFVNGNDVFVSLPTGYGKSAIYAMLPYVFDAIRGVSGSIVVCISPLTALMMEQAAKYKACGLKTEYIGYTQTSMQAKKSVLSGEEQLVFFTPERIIQNHTYRSMLLSSVYKEKLVCIAVDEAHCVKVWGAEFRPMFAEIGTLRSIIPSNVKLIALTATATSETYHVVVHQLTLVNPVLVAIPPHRHKINFKASPKVSMEQFILLLSKEVEEKQDKFPKTIEYDRTYADCGTIYLQLKQSLGKNFTHPPGYPNHKDYRLIDMFNAVLTVAKKKEVIEMFTRTDSKLCLLIATTALGMGVNCSNIRRIIHWGIPTTLEEYVQETGRSGRDGENAVAMLYRGVGGRKATARVKAYVDNIATCRRHLLFQDFLLYSESSITVSGCKCCDVCLLTFTCTLCSF